MQEAFITIRAGVGSVDVAPLVGGFAWMYTRYGHRQGWQSDIIHMHETKLRSLDRVTLRVRGEDVQSGLRHEPGVHRIKRTIAREGLSLRTCVGAIVVELKPFVVCLRDLDPLLGSKELAKAERARTLNFDTGLVTDHRIASMTFDLLNMLDGDLSPILTRLG